ncbi:LysR family transcriptional regulator [Bradyrhizobium barranii subsp. apii]|uniref:LysR family transcriptional regulator n=1 Tax=Bradyrhizobium barranii TaxID=2992140 RepID=UPI002058770C|nr:LysR family transcriptional regulator [Bradyrhizobium barranii]UPU01094.1 LysR family transcriptional regulator [Bradyrhizobium barranii subsp. apii]
MEERHVTRAGQRIGLAQPSMSSTLTRLRALFGDELFVRSASGMQPTAKALARPISDALGQIRGVLEPTSAFNPATARHRLSNCGDRLWRPRRGAATGRGVAAGRAWYRSRSAPHH